MIELAEHFKEEVMGDDSIAAEVAKLWKTHGKASALIADRRPTLMNLRAEYEKGLRRELEKTRPGLLAGLDLSVYPETRGDMTEIKVCFASWKKAGLPMYVMLYAMPQRDEGRPCVDLRIWGKDYSKYEAGFARMAERVNRASSGTVNPSFPPFAGWGNWRRVLVTPCEPRDDWSFDGEVVTWAVRRARELIVLADAWVTA
jgi:hypothetical protein